MSRFWLSLSPASSRNPSALTRSLFLSSELAAVAGWRDREIVPVQTPQHNPKELPAKTNLPDGIIRQYQDKACDGFGHISYRPVAKDSDYYE